MTDSYRTSYLETRGGRNTGKVKVCKKCKKIYPDTGYGGDYCPSCHKADEMILEQLQQYVEINSTDSMEIVSEKTGIEDKIIIQYLKDKRLIVSEDSPLYIECEMCRKKIHTGRLCIVCSQKLNQLFK